MVEHPDRANFLDLYENMSNENALQEAQEPLICSGAVNYCVDQLLRRHQTTLNILNKSPLPSKKTIDALLEGVIAPVQKLFETLGISPNILPTAVELSNQE
jgi:hypothetical protein